MCKRGCRVAVMWAVIAFGAPRAVWRHRLPLCGTPLLHPPPASCREVRPPFASTAYVVWRGAIYVQYDSSAILWLSAPALQRLKIQAKEPGGSLLTHPECSCVTTDIPAGRHGTSRRHEFWDSSLHVLRSGFISFTII